MADKATHKFMSKSDRTRLLEQFRSQSHGRTPADAIEVLEAFGFEFERQVKAGLHKYTHPTERDVSVTIGITGHNITRPQGKDVVKVCDEITKRSEAAAVEMTEYVEAVYIKEAPELREYVRIKKSYTPEIKQNKIGEAIGRLTVLEKAHTAKLDHNQANYGIKVIRDIENHTITLSALDCNIQREFNYTEALPHQVAEFVAGVQKEAEDVLERRSILLQEFLALNAQMAGEPKGEIRLIGPHRTGSKPMTLTTFGPAEFLTADSERQLHEAILAVHKKVEEIAAKQHAPQAPKPIVVLQDGVLDKTYTAITMNLSAAALAAKQRLFTTVSEALGIPKKDQLLAALPDLLRIGGNAPQQFFDPEHKAHPTEAHRNDIRALRLNLERLLNETLPEQRGKATTIRNACSDFMTIAVERTKEIGDGAVDRVAPTSSWIDGRR